MQPRIQIGFDLPMHIARPCQLPYQSSPYEREKGALNPLVIQPVFVLGVAPPQVQDLACCLVDLPEVDMGSFL